MIYCKHGGSISNFVLDTLQTRGVNVCFIEGGLSACKEEKDAKPPFTSSAFVGVLGAVRYPCRHE